MEIIEMRDLIGEFAENKDIVKDLRVNHLLPALANNRAITFDFKGVKGATQSFIHALVSDAIRKYPDIIFDNVFYRNANEEIQKIITIVYRYMQESLV